MPSSEIVVYLEPIFSPYESFLGYVAMNRGSFF